MLLYTKHSLETGSIIIPHCENKETEAEDG